MNHWAAHGAIVTGIDMAEAFFECCCVCMHWKMRSRSLTDRLRQNNWQRNARNTGTSSPVSSCLNMYRIRPGIVAALQPTGQTRRCRLLLHPQSQPQILFSSHLSEQSMSLAYYPEAHINMKNSFDRVNFTDGVKPVTWRPSRRVESITIPFLRPIDWQTGIDVNYLAYTVKSTDQ